MTTMSDSPEIELLHRAWEAMTGGDFAVLELKGSADRATAQAYLASGEAAAAPVLPPPPANHNHFGGE
jgi:hypothetical protein